MASPNVFLRWIKHILLVFAALIALGALGLWIYYLINRPSADLRVAYEVREQTLRRQMHDGSPLQFAKVFTQATDVASEYPGSAGALVALQTATSLAKSDEESRLAITEFKKHLDQSDFDALVRAIQVGVPPWKSMAPLAGPLLEKVETNSSHPQAGTVTAAVCVILKPKDGVVDPLYRKAADMIRDRYAAQTDIQRFAESLTSPPVVNEPWTYEYEPHLREIVRVNKDGFSRCSSMFALAMIIKDQPQRYQEAVQMLEDFCKEYPGDRPSSFQIIEENYHFFAKSFLEEMRFQAAGMPAIETVGVDLEGKPLNLQDHRGKVVLLSFWATWCGPCIKFIPHEIELKESYSSRPFEVVGVNVDTDRAKANQVAKERGVTWRSFVSDTDGPKSIASSWNVIAYPTIFLIDHHGVIRRRWIDAPSNEELNDAVQSLVMAAENKTPVDQMANVKLSSSVPAQAPSDSASNASTDAEVRKKISERAYVDTSGATYKYAIYDHVVERSQTPPTVIMFLHGAGARGDKGDQAIENCMALLRAIEVGNADKSIAVVIPVARDEESWMADSVGGKRVMDILDLVQRENQWASSRLVLTGYSMGGQGTWSLAAADPNRFAAIVPICHGGDAGSASILAKIPCWCFHGEADPVIPVTQSRDMIEAITKAGGQPRYTVLSGVGHEQAAQVAYSNPEVLSWMLGSESKP